MVSYQPVVHTTAQSELGALPDEQRNRLTDVLHEVAQYREPTKHPKCRQLEGQRDLFRVRVGEVRAILTLQKPELRILRVGHRTDVYEIIDEIDDRRATA